MRATARAAAAALRPAAIARGAASLSAPHIPASSFLAVNAYVSEGRDPTTLAALAAAAASRQRAGDAQEGAALVHTFVDAPYNRTGFTLAGAPAGLSAAVLALCDAALASIDWGAVAAPAASASHPALGAVDHVAVHPLFPAAAGARDAATALATSLGAALGARGVPVYQYGWASPTGASLADVRRSLGYFSRGKRGGEASPRPPPDAGPMDPPPRSGVAVVGATPWVVNVNVPLPTADVALARAIGRAVSTRGGGRLPSLEAMGLAHGDATEVACNVRDPAAVTVADVRAAVVEAAAARGVAVTGDAYVTGRAPGDVAAEAARVLGCRVVE